MENNEVNKKLYESAFVSDGTFGDLNNWKPDIDERLIEESTEDENGNWIPATPLGYRDYKLSREEGLNTIFYESTPSRVFTLEDAHNIKREDNIIKKYDLITIDKSNYIVVGDDENYLGILCKYDLDGNFMAYNDYKSTDNTGFSGIVNIGDKIYVSGANMQENDLTDAMIVMYDTNCNYLKQVTYDAKGTERFNKLVLDDNNNIVAIGTLYTARKNNHNTVDEYDYDGIIAKYNSNLEKLDDVRYGDERDDFFTDVIFIHNKYIIVGYSSYEDGSYMSKFISYSKAFKVLEVE